MKYTGILIKIALIGILGLVLESCKEELFVPELTTTTVSTITSTTANSGGNIISNGGETVTTRGVCWSTSQMPMVSDNKTNDGVGEGSFTSEMTGLTPETIYYVRAYATNSVGTGYGNQLSFTTELACDLVCDIGTESYSISITCESGGTSTTFNNQSTEYEYDSLGRMSGIKLNLDQTRTYLDSNNTYTIVGVINVDLINETETHNITVSGGRFTNPRVCN